MTKHTISKSQYVKGLQCPKALWLFRRRRACPSRWLGLQCSKLLWLFRHRKDLASEITPEKQSLFDTGHEVGKLAMQYFDDGIEVASEYWDVKGAVEATEQYIKDGHNLIFEATAIHPINGGYARIDILKRVDGTDEWDLIEVKSSTKVKDYHIDDMSFQYHVFCGAGYKIRKCFMMVINNEYVKNGEIDPKQLLKLEEKSEDVHSKQEEVASMAEQLVCVLERKDEPEVPIGARCFKPFECDYRPYCWKHVPEYSVYDVFQKPRAEEIAQNYGVDVKDLPDDLHPNGIKGLDVKSYLNDEGIVDHTNISSFLNKIQYPLYFLDYETLSAAIPMFDGTWPYQQIPFQFSVHVQDSPEADLVHHEYLHKERTDPRRSFIENLIENCGNEGTVMVYDQRFEIGRNKELARDFPEFSTAIEDINARVLDLLLPFKNRWLYNPKQNSSASIKAALPAFTDLSYEHLEISHGEEAMLQYGNFMKGLVAKNKLPSLWKNLTEYCKQDTYAMVLLLNALKEAST